jgi:hypothetical protein
MLLYASKHDDILQSVLKRRTRPVTFYDIVNCARTVATTFESPTWRTSASVTVCAKHEAHIKERKYHCRYRQESAIEDGSCEF